jgi:hypothetical protein
MRLSNPPRCASNSLTKPNRQYLVLPGGYLSPTNSDCCKAGSFECNKPYIRVNFGMIILIPRIHFLKILIPFMSSIYIATLIFTRNIIISVKIKLSLRLTRQRGRKCQKFCPKTHFSMNAVYGVMGTAVMHMMMSAQPCSPSTSRCSPKCSEICNQIKNKDTNQNKNKHL